MNVTASTILYALGKQLGKDGAMKEFERQVAKPDKQSLPVVRTLARLRGMCDLAVYVDTGGTCIGKGRSRAFDIAFSQRQADAWISIDDDSEVTTDTVAAMIEVLDDALHPRIVVVPFMLRGSGLVNIAMPKVRAVEHYNGVKLVRLPHGTAAGFGMVGMNRRAMLEIMTYHKAKGGLEWTDETSGRKALALFLDELTPNGVWHNEDVAFFRRLPPDLGVDVLLAGISMHAGNALNLAELDQVPTFGWGDITNIAK